MLNYYFNNGFPNATFDASAKRSANDPNLMDVTYTVHTGDQVIVDQVYVAGMVHTRDSIVQREIQIKPGDPLSQIDMLNTQKSLYDLGHLQPGGYGGAESGKQRAGKECAGQCAGGQALHLELWRWDWNSRPASRTVNGTNPLGETGVSPRVSFGVTRLNLRGLNHTDHVQGQRRTPAAAWSGQLTTLRGWFNNPNWRLTFTTFYDNTVDVTTFTSQRLEGSVAAEQTISKTTIMTYRLTYRRVKASDITNTISPDQIPLLSQPTRVGIPNFSYIRNKRDNDLESTKGNYTTIDGGVASTYFGSETDFGRLLIQNSSYYSSGQEPGAEGNLFWLDPPASGLKSLTERLSCRNPERNAKLLRLDKPRVFPWRNVSSREVETRIADLA